MTALPHEQYRALLEARIFDPESLRRALVERRRRTVPGDDGRLVILAADHTARGMLAVDSDPLAVADRFGLLDRLVRALAQPGVDGVLASADLLEELAWLGALDDRLAIGTMNRGGVIGATWELDDRMTAYDTDHIEAYGLDGGKTLLRIDESDPAVARTIESVAATVTELSDRRLMCMIEPLPYRKDNDGRARLDPSVERLIKVVAVASGLGSSSAYSWLKVPGSDRMAEVAAATTLPILMLGGDPGPDAEAVFVRWEAAMKEPNVRGLVAGRALLYPQGEDTEQAVRRAAHIVHGGAS
ncbi:MAG: deoxyribose-phosphate aldolase [Actinomycetes bacterium]